MYKIIAGIAISFSLVACNYSSSHSIAPKPDLDYSCISEFVRGLENVTDVTESDRSLTFMRNDISTEVSYISGEDDQYMLEIYTNSFSPTKDGLYPSALSLSEEISKQCKVANT